MPGKTPGYGLIFISPLMVKKHIMNNEWVQYDKSWLNKPALIAIWSSMDSYMMKKNSGIANSYFYDVLAN
jgi:hypothetical protein